VAHHRRSQELAKCLGLREVYYSTRVARQPTPIRYICALVATVWVLLRYRPPAVVVMAPPTIPVFVVSAYARLVGARVVIDAHSGMFNSAPWDRTANAALRSAGRRGGLIVTNRAVTAGYRVPDGLRSFVVHNSIAEAPPTAQPGPITAETGKPIVVVPASWSDDEPLAALALAARSLDDCQVVITGRPGKGPTRDALETAGVRITGYLNAPDYAALVGGCDVVLALTTRPNTMQQGGYEALAHAKPLVTSDHQVLREFFGEAAVFVSSESADIADGVRRALRNAMELGAAADRVRKARNRERAVAVEELISFLSIGSVRAGAVS
jgi:glycosyltransferase involved in cell wall biosynthesis